MTQGLSEALWPVWPEWTRRWRRGNTGGCHPYWHVTRFCSLRVAKFELPELHSAMRTLVHKTDEVVSQLQLSQQKAMRAEQIAAVGRLAAGLAHELRNPLTSMKLLVQAAAERQSGIRGRDREILEEEIVRLDNMLQNFLDFARPPQPQKQNVHLYQVIDQSVQLVQPRASAQGVQIHCRDVPHERAILADPAQLRQVFLNLLINAIDVLPDGGTVTVRGYSVEDEEPMAVIEVADSGPGLSEQMEDRIFEPFVSSKETGIGLGLAISKRIVESHGGQIYASNRSCGGAVFTVQLPESGEAVIAV